MAIASTMQVQACHSHSCSFALPCCIPLKHAMQPRCLGRWPLVDMTPVTVDHMCCRELDSGSSTPSSMPPSAVASPRRWSSFGNRGRLSEEGGAMLRRASEAAGVAEAGLHLPFHAPPKPSGASSPDNGTTCTLCTKLHSPRHLLISHSL